MMRLLYAAWLVQAVQAVDFSTTANLSSWNQNDWTLTTHKYVPGEYQSRISLANGYVGASLAAAGPFFEVDANQTDATGPPPTNGWPLFDSRLSFSTISGFYNSQKNTTGTNFPWLTQYGWDSFIAGIPHPTTIGFEFGHTCLNSTTLNTTITNFKSTLSFKTGVAEWSYTWKPKKGPRAATFEVHYSVIFSRKRHNVIATKATITPSRDANGTVTDLLDGRSALRSNLATRGTHFSRSNNKLESTVYAAVHPDNLPKTTGWVVSEADFAPATGNGRTAKGDCISTNPATIGQTFDIYLKANKTATFYKYVGVASTDKFKDAEKTARRAASDAKSEGWDSLLKEHTKAWAEIMTPDSIDDFADDSGELPDDENIEALQIGSISSTFYLLQNLLPDDGTGLNDNAISVGGLASDSYAGQVFWDADYWMAPSLNLAFPKFAKQIPNFRVKQHGEAIKNAAFNKWPNGTALYPWTTGRYGNCTATGPCVDYQYHLNHDIAFNILQLQNVTQNDTWFKDGPEAVILGAAEMSAHLLQYDNKTGQYVIKNATDPDEYANHVNNTAFTLASASQLLTRANEMLASQGKAINETWTKIAENIAFPRAKSNITLEYTGMNNSLVVKQADIVLISYPLGFEQNYTKDNSLLDLDYYSNKQSADGPAMTWSAFAVVANTVSPSGCAAYTYTLHSFLPYLRQPWYQFSEQQIDDPEINGGTHPAFPFLTGHGGSLQVGLFAFLGIRTDREALYLSPSLPPQIPHLKVRKFYHGDATFHATMNGTHTNLTSTHTVPILIANDDSDTPTKHTIKANETMTISNRRYFEKNTYDNNILQCLPVTSDDDFAAGQLPVGLNDGATATAWQPQTQELTRITVNTSSVAPQQVKGIHFDFGTRPVESATVWFYNVTDGVRSGSTIAVDNVKPNTKDQDPKNPVPVKGNTTTMAIPEKLNLWTGDFVELTVQGCEGCDGNKGATISEFVVY